MKINRRGQFSPKILKRIEDRKVARKNNLFYAALLGSFAISLLTLSVCTVAKVWKDWVEVRPTWAQFSVHDPFQERNPGAYDDGMPSTLLINGEAWNIVRVTSFDDAKDANGKPKTDSFYGYMAQTYCSQKVIAYIPHGDVGSLRDTIVHELFHAGRCLHKEDDGWWNTIDGDSTKHPGIYHLGDFMAEFALANPAFMKWISTP